MHSFINAGRLLGPGSGSQAAGDALAQGWRALEPDSGCVALAPRAEVIHDGVVGIRHHGGGAGGTDLLRILGVRWLRDTVQGQQSRQLVR